MEQWSMTDRDKPKDKPFSSEDLIARAREEITPELPSAPRAFDISTPATEPEIDTDDAVEQQPTPEPEPLAIEPTETWQPPSVTPPPEATAPSPWAPPSGRPAETRAPAPIPSPTDRIATSPAGVAKKRNLKPLLVVAAVVAALGWGAFNADTSIEDVAVGDCFNNPDADEVTSIKTIPCEEQHDYEVMRIFVYPEGDDALYPDPDDLWQTAVDGCIPDFQGYTGLVWENETELFIDAFYPLENSWDAGDREAWCLLVRVDPDTFDIVPQVGSLRSN
jgi:Septum formation